MNPAPVPPVLASPPPTAWPARVQLALAFLLGVTTTFLLVQFLGRWLWVGRPSELRQPDSAFHRVDLNHADRVELKQIPGVGDSLAHRIEQHRTRTGGFRSVEELRDVPGVGPATVERMRDWVRAEEPEPYTDRGMPATGATGGSPAKISVGDEPINVNRATAEQLQRLPGIGPKLSQRIVEERRKGNFKSVDDLKRVSGIGVKTVERLRPLVSMGAAPPTVTMHE